MCSNKLPYKLRLGFVLTKQSDCKGRGGSVANSLQSVCITWEREGSFVLYPQMFVLLLFPLCFHVLVFLLRPRQFISSHLGLEAGPGRTGKFVTVWHMECVNCDTAKGCYCRLKKKKRTVTSVSKWGAALAVRTCLVLKKSIFDKSMIKCETALFLVCKGLRFFNIFFCFILFSPGEAVVGWRKKKGQRKGL